MAGNMNKIIQKAWYNILLLRHSLLLGIRHNHINPTEDNCNSLINNCRHTIRNPSRIWALH